MDPLFGLVLTSLFQLILLLALVHYHRRLGYPFLKYGAAAMAVSMVAHVLSHLDWSGAYSTVTLSIWTGVNFVYVSLLLLCAVNIVSRPIPVRSLTGLALVMAGLAIYLQLVAEPSVIQLVALQFPVMAVLVLGAYLLMRHRTENSISALGVAGLLILQSVVPLMLLFSGTAVAAENFQDLVILLTGVTLLMITAERTLGDVANRDLKIEEYAAERRRLELQFSQTQKLESLGILAGGIAHDFNNMLTSILGYASLAMKKLPVDSEVRKDLYMVMSGARQAVDLTSQMLTYAGKGALEFETVDISKVVENMSSLIQSVVPGKVQVVKKIARGLPDMKADRVQLGQVLMNLVGNAVDAIESNSGVIEISTGLSEIDDLTLRGSFFSEEREPGAYLYLRVKDSGIGMDEEQVARIFDPFYSDKQTNKGLGLSSLSGVVRQHNGFINVKSRPGLGSEFTVFFPVVAFNAGDEPGEPIEKRSARKKSILLADDDSRIRTLMGSILESDHFQLTLVEDGREAFRQFEEGEEAFDLLVLDCTMPKMSGTEVYRKVRASGAQLPVVLVSGYHQEQVARHISSDPNARFIKKPFSVDEFLEEVHEALDAYNQKRTQST
jgi:signal transduction histidine kinase/CheY-like chemotaxis protein